MRELGLDARTFIPASAKQGENVATSEHENEMVLAANVLEALDLLKPQERDADLPLRFCVQDVYRFDERRIIAGRIETGTSEGRGPAGLFAGEQNVGGRNDRALERAGKRAGRRW